MDKNEIQTAAYSRGSRTALALHMQGAAASSVEQGLPYEGRPDFLGQGETVRAGTPKFLVKYLLRQNQRQQVGSAQLLLFQRHTENPRVH